MSFDYAALMNQHAMLQVQCQHWQKECMKLEGERDQLKADNEAYNKLHDWLKEKLDYANQVIEQRHAMIDALMVDAERYRWLRCRTTTERIALIGHLYDADMDAAIDAARG